MNMFIKNTKHLHFIGIGGIGMSGMAELLYNHGFKITGSDLKKSNRTKHLSKYKDIKIKYKHSKENISSCDVIVYSSAIDKNNPEIKEGYSRNIPIIKRAELLSELLKIKEISIAIGGTHGKTTTSSMLGNILHEAKKDPTLIIGGIVNKFNSNNISGSGKIIVVEADEFDKSFLTLKPTYSILNNLDLEHLDCYKDLDDLLDTFTKFANSVPFYGKIAINVDSKNLSEILKKINRPKTTFGIKNNCNIRAKNIKHIHNLSYCDICISPLNKNFKIKIPYPGIYNIYNALAAISIAVELKIPIKDIIKGIESYAGVKRRFEIKYNKNNIMIIDDYAHHPSEISATIEGIKKGWNKRIISIFQPHLYTRTKDFYKEFAYSLDKSDISFITKVYPAREKLIKGVSSKLITNNMKNKKTFYIHNKKEIVSKLIKIINKNDIILIMGAGNINSITDNLINKVDKIKW